MDEGPALISKYGSYESSFKKYRNLALSWVKWIQPTFLTYHFRSYPPISDICWTHPHSSFFVQIGIFFSKRFVMPNVSHDIKIWRILRLQIIYMAKNISNIQSRTDDKRRSFHSVGSGTNNPPPPVKNSMLRNIIRSGISTSS
jgi:hypothetical protein